MIPSNLLYYGDNLDILRRYVSDESVDLIYLDPPFNSAQTYNVLFAEKNGSSAASQIKAFDDTWHWDQTAAAIFLNTIREGGLVSDTLQAFRRILGENDLLAYLTMMAPRLLELRRVLKSNGSLYLHCDTTAGHYLKILLDSVFGKLNFQNQIIWKRTSAHNDPKRYGRNTDFIFFYTKSEKYIWNQIYLPHDPKYLSRFRNQDPDGRKWADYDLTAKGLTGGGYKYEYQGITSLWRCPLETMQKLDAEGRLHFTKQGGIRLKRYLDENKGIPLQCLWDDIPPINSQAKERLGFPTQKPEALLERIIATSSNPNDTVLDPFCGCGTTIAVAQHLDRRWIGIDITYLAISLIKNRLRDAFGNSIPYQVIGEPISLPDAVALAKQDPFQFQWWALGLVGARPVEPKKGADQGIDGKLFFQVAGNQVHQILISVKSGHVSVSTIRDLRGVLEREQAAMGVLITLEAPTKPMQSEAVSAGFYEAPGWNRHYPRIQIFTIEELLSGKSIDRPPDNQTFKRAPQAKKPLLDSGSLLF